MLRSSIRIVSLTAFGLLAVAAQAQVVNGGFETGASENATTIVGWSTVGNAFTSTTAHFSDPADGAFQATLGTSLDGQYGEHAGSGVSAGAAESLLGLSAGSLSNVGNGRAGRVSAIAQTVRMNVGDQFVFSFDFLTDEVVQTNDPTSAYNSRPDVSRNDFGFLSFSVGGTSSVIKLIDTFYGYSSTGPGQDDFVTGFTLTPDTDPLFSESGYLNYTFTATTAGDYLFGLGVADGERGATGVSGLPSGMLIDSVRYVPNVVTPPNPATPAPAAMAAFGLGLAGRARRRKRA